MVGGLINIDKVKMILVLFAIRHVDILNSSIMNKALGKD